ncbi:MAG: serine/threonine protein kinase [Deltaproteobacteria bacterium]|jgi:serine/threonine-protein kinase Stk1|nr:serine/threonine protein kinase [Deltaproteobacteria bacterium]
MENIIDFTDLISPAPFPAKALPDDRPARFLLGQALGEGSMCEVFEATDQSRAEWGDPRPKVAIKKLLPEFRQNAHARLALAQEFFKARDLLHPGVVRMYDLHLEDNEPMLSMELLRGQTLRDYLASPSPPPIPRLAAAAGIFAALSHIHQKGLAHADLKPGNVFLCPGRTVIFDFNISAVLPSDREKASSPIQSLVTSKSLPGHTVAYASLERLQGAPPTLADDIFAASATAYELLTGRHPFSRLPADQAAQKRIVPGRPDGLSRKGWKYLSAGLSLRPEKRPSAGEICRVFAP